MTIAELIRRLKVQCQDNIDIDVEIISAEGDELNIEDIYYEGNGPLVIVEVE